MGFVTSTNKKPEKQPVKKERSGFRKFAGFVGGVAKEVAISIPRALATPFATAYQDFTGLATGKRPESVQVPLLGEIGISNDPKKALGQGLSRSLDIALTATGGKVIQAGAKSTIEEGVKAGFKGAAKEFVKQAPKDFAIGAAYGTATGLSEEQQAEDLLRSAATGGIIGTLLPPVAGTALKVIGRGSSALVKKLGSSLEETAQVLEKKAAALPVSRKEKRFYQERYEKPTQTFGQKVAEKTAAGIRQAKKIPASFQEKFINKYDAIKRFQGRLSQEGIDAGDLEEAVAGARYRAYGNAENKLDDYFALKDSFGDDWRYVKEYSNYLDDLDRIAAGNTIAGGRKVDDVRRDIEGLLSSLPENKRTEIVDGQKRLQKFLNQELLDAVESGRLSPESYQAITAMHPNYIPHDVLDFIDEGIGKVQPGTSKSFQLTKSGIEKAKGSMREIDDIDNAVIRRLMRNSILDEKNKANLAIMDSVLGVEEKFGFKPLKTAANVKARKKYYEDIRRARAALDEFKQELSSTKLDKKKNAQKIKKMEEKLSEAEAKFHADLLAYEGESADKILAQYEKAVKNKYNLEGLRFFEKDVEDQYQSFKKFSSRNKKILEMDPDQIRKNYGDDIVENTFFGSRGGRTDDEMLQMFKNRLREEARIGKPKLGFIRKVESREKKLTESETKMLQMEKNISGEKQIAVALDEKMEGISQFIDLADNQKNQLFSDVKLLRDVEAKKVDYQKDGFEKFSFFRDGVKEEWLIPEDIGRAMKNLNDTELQGFAKFMNSTVGKIVGAPANITRKLATGINPVFALFSNPLRDIQTVKITAELKAKDYAEGLASALTGNYKNADDLYRLARKEGALQGSIFRELNEPEKKLLEKLNSKNGQQSIISKVVNTGKDLASFKWVETGGKMMEEATRLGVFSRAIKNGMTPREAAKLARNSTVDFGRSGIWIEQANKVIPFLNARIQGFSNLITSAKNDPTKFVRQGMYTAAWPAVALTAHNTRFEGYQNIPDSEKRKFWIVMVGQTKGKSLDGKDITIPYYIKIPKGEAQQAISNVVERVLTVGQQKYPETTGQFVKQLLKDTSPIMESSILPPGLSQWAELKSNYSFFREKQIEGEYTKIGNKWFKTSEIPAEFRANWNTSEAAKYLGEVMGWSPAKIDYVIKMGLMNDLIRIGDLTAEGWSKQEATGFEKAAELPFLRSIIGTSSYGQDLKEKEIEKKAIEEKNAAKIRQLQQLPQTTKTQSKSKSPQSGFVSR